MRKVVVVTIMSVNGVISDPHLWSFDNWSDELEKAAYETLFASDVLIMGRDTYEGFAEAWSSRAGADEFADRMNSLPKYVASRTLTAPLEWNANLIEGDIAEFVTKLKQEPGQDILQYGSGELTETLMKHGLVDELRLMVYPVVLEGQQLFANIDKTSLELLSTRTFSTGVVAMSYRPKKQDE